MTVDRLKAVAMINYDAIPKSARIPTRFDNRTIARSVNLCTIWYFKILSVMHACSSQDRMNRPELVSVTESEFYTHRTYSREMIHLPFPFNTPVSNCLK